MLNKRILVTGAGGDSGLSVIRIMKENGHYVHACDANEDSSGLYLADSYSIIPFASNEKEFVEKIKEIVVKNKIEVIFPNVDEELKIFAKYSEEIPCSVVISPLETIEICQNKIDAINFLKELIPTPRTNDSFERYPLIVRPVVSRGSRNVYKVENESERRFFLDYIKKRNLIPMIQEFLSGDEYTIDALFDLEGNLIVAAPRRRISTKGGISSLGKSEKNDELIEYVRKISKKLKFFGPVNIQFKRDEKGIFKLLEINPRCSGGLTITYKNGLNLPEILLKILEKESILDEELEYQEGKVFRYLSEI